MITAATEFFMQEDPILIISIMQPTFLPWIGYFNLIARSDYFIFLDNVQFEARSWQQRNRILINGKVAWVTIPVSKPNGSLTKINEVLINREHFQPLKLCQTIRRAYSKKPGLEWLEKEIFPVISSTNFELGKLNVELIESIAKGLGLDTVFLKSSNLKTVGNKEELLESILLNFDEVEYFSPRGSSTYLDKLGGRFLSGIPITFQDFQHPEYNQGNSEFISHLSIVDAIASVGIDEVRNLIK